MNIIKSTNEFKTQEYLKIISDALNLRYLPKGFEVIFKSKENKVYSSIHMLERKEGTAYLRNSKTQQVLAIVEFDKSDVKSYYTEDGVYMVNIRKHDITEEYRAGWNACVNGVTKLPRCSKKNEDFLEGYSDCEWVTSKARYDAIANSTNPILPLEI